MHCEKNDWLKTILPLLEYLSGVIYMYTVARLKFTSDIF
jgi:hypothetical protein